MGTQTIQGLPQELDGVSPRFGSSMMAQRFHVPAKAFEDEDSDSSDRSHDGVRYQKNIVGNAKCSDLNLSSCHESFQMPSSRRRKIKVDLTSSLCRLCYST